MHLLRRYPVAGSIHIGGFDTSLHRVELFNAFLQVIGISPGHRRRFMNHDISVFRHLAFVGREKDLCSNAAAVPINYRRSLALAPLDHVGHCHTGHDAATAAVDVDRQVLVPDFIQLPLNIGRPIITGP